MIQASFRIVVPPEKHDELLGVLLCLKGPTEVASGCRTCRILQDAEDDRALTYLVQWDAQDQLEEHIRSERFRMLLPYIEMSIDPPGIDIGTIDHIRGIEFLVAAIGSPEGPRRVGGTPGGQPSRRGEMK